MEVAAPALNANGKVAEKTRKVRREMVFEVIWGILPTCILGREPRFTQLLLRKKNRVSLAGSSSSRPLRPGNDAAHDHVQNRNEEQIQRGRGNHSPKNGRAHGNASRAPSALGKHQGNDAEDERKRGHQDGAKADARSLHGSFDERQSLGAQLLGELDNQNGVLAGEADKHHQPDLAVDVVLQSAQRLRAQSSEQSYRHGQQHDKRQHVALILRGERQVNHHKAQREKNQRLSARLDFFQGEPAPFEGHAVGKNLLCQRFHRGDAFTGTAPGRRRAVDFRRAKQIVVANDLGIRGLLNRHQIVERDHLAGGGTEVIFPDIFGLRAELAVGLNIDAVGAVVEVEVVHINRAHIDLQRVGDLAERHLQTLGFFAVDLNDVLGIVSGEAAEESDQIFARVSFGCQLVGGFGEGFEGIASQVLKFKGESTELAQAEDGRRIKRDYHRAGDRRKAAAEAPDHGGRRVMVAFAFFERFEARVHEGLIGRTAGRALPNDGKDSLDLRIARDDLLCSRADVARIAQRSALRSLYRENQVALVVLGEKRARHPLIHKIRGREERQENHQRRRAQVQQPPHASTIQAGASSDHFVEPVEETELRAFAVMPKKNRGQGRGQGQRVESGDRHGEGDREGKLAEQNSCCPGKERYGHKYRNQNQRSRNHGSRDFFHGRGGGIVRLGDAFGDVPLHVFDDHDGVVDHQPRG